MAAARRGPCSIFYPINACGTENYFDSPRAFGNESSAERTLDSANGIRIWMLPADEDRSRSWASFRTYRWPSGHNSHSQPSRRVKRTKHSVYAHQSVMTRVSSRRSTIDLLRPRLDSSAIQPLWLGRGFVFLQRLRIGALCPTIKSGSS